MDTARVALEVRPDGEYGEEKWYEPVRSLTAEEQANVPEPVMAVYRRAIARDSPQLLMASADGKTLYLASGIQRISRLSMFFAENREDPGCEQCYYLGEVCPACKQSRESKE